MNKNFFEIIPVEVYYKETKEKRMMIISASFPLTI